ncbi:unnamed protein product [Linum tenue]|uniref:Uncharacterized protein n=1 Tax=Linum tenue TaxID=586396 RepID=A0AAV0MPL3_9ROSI|nr:unnamed protein product [Linum tenue]
MDAPLAFGVKTTLLVPSHRQPTDGAYKLPAAALAPYSHCFLKSQHPPKLRSRSTRCRELHAAYPQQRRSGNYGPNIWESHDYSHPPNRDNTTLYWQEEEAEELKKDAKQKVLRFITATGGDDDDETVARRVLETIDTVQKLGLAYYFETEIQDALDKIATTSTCREDLYFSALRFRLLRQAGIWISSDAFQGFLDQGGKFRQEIIGGDARALLSLYEASYLSVPGETLLDEAKSFARRHLQSIIAAADDKVIGPMLANQVKRTLELPSHWRLQRSQVRWHIEQYCNQYSEEIMDPALLRFAMLDYNTVQFLYQSELDELNRWWKYELAIPEKLPFARDRLTESFLWAVGLAQEPHFSYCRKTMSKLVCIVNVVDDVYDIYASLDELHLFTAAIQRWDPSKIDTLPVYMQTCFMAVYNTTNELADHNIMQQGFNSLPFLKQAWQEQCKLYLEEAEAFHTIGFEESFEQYLERGWKSVATSIVLVYTYAASGATLATQSFEYLLNYPKFTRWVSTANRLINDLATSKAELGRGDILKSVESYMKEKGVSEKEARLNIEWQIGETWMRINEEAMANYGDMKIYVNLGLNLARGFRFMYQYGDGNGMPTPMDKDRAMALIWLPFTIKATEETTAV